MRLGVCFLAACVALPGCAAKTSINFRINRDKAFAGHISNVVVNVRSPAGQAKYASGFIQRSVDFPAALSKALKAEFKAAGAECQMIKSGELTLEETSVEQALRTAGADYYFEVRHAQSTELNTITTSMLFNASLYFVPEKRRIWRSRIEVERVGIGAAGLDQSSADRTAAAIITQLKSAGLL
jgi:hypothetical protein